MVISRAARTDAFTGSDWRDVEGKGAVTYTTIGFSESPGAFDAGPA